MNFYLYEKVEGMLKKRLLREETNYSRIMYAINRNDQDNLSPSSLRANFHSFLTKIKNQEHFLESNLFGKFIHFYLQNSYLNSLKVNLNTESLKNANLKNIENEIFISELRNYLECKILKVIYEENISLNREIQQDLIYTFNLIDLLNESLMIKTISLVNEAYVHILQQKLIVNEKANLLNRINFQEKLNSDNAGFDLDAFFKEINNDYLMPSFSSPEDESSPESQEETESKTEQNNINADTAFYSTSSYHFFYVVHPNQGSNKRQKIDQQPFRGSNFGS